MRGSWMRLSGSGCSGFCRSCDVGEVVEAVKNTQRIIYNRTISLKTVFLLQLAAFSKHLINDFFL